MYKHVVSRNMSLYWKLYNRRITCIKECTTIPQNWKFCHVTTDKLILFFLLTELTFLDFSFYLSFVSNLTMFFSCLPVQNLVSLGSKVYFLLIIWKYVSVGYWQKYLVNCVKSPLANINYFNQPCFAHYLSEYSADTNREPLKSKISIIFQITGSIVYNFCTQTIRQITMVLNNLIRTLAFNFL